LKNWNWIGWLKAVFILVSCAATLFSLIEGERTTLFHEQVSCYWFVIFGVISVLFNVFTDRIFRKNIIEKPKWNDNPFNLKYPMRAFQLLGVCSAVTGGLGFLLYALRFSEFSTPYNALLGIGIGVLIGVSLLIRFRKRNDE